MKGKNWLKTLGIFLLILLGGMFFAYPLLKEKKVLPVYQPADINPKLVDSSKVKITRDHTVADFRLLNQLGDTVTENVLKNKIYVADFFFATCPSICPVMSSNIAKLQDEFSDEGEVMFLSHSVTPQLDSVEVLAEYADRYGANPKRWMLLTGDKKQIYDLARKSYFAVLDEGDGGVQDFIHTENFILVDKKKRLRGFYDGTSDNDIKKLTEDIRVLLNEDK